MAHRVDQADPERHQIINESTVDPCRLTIMQQDAIVRGALYCAFGFALRRFFLSLSLFFLAPCLPCTVAIGTMQTVIRPESH